ncbi:oxidoreductase [Agromyces sp. CFH 90414]|uniref:Oxidoreductase n=1 Tax=Agromyces agglutinans TaxID=2662258 RepID=A0A6I2F3H7_9MICO|nr:FAD-binding oxidoreductase [Agromyces agglutinans]MRG58944.1 oxidoreductase [Agromyces agglutinans]
MTRAAWHVATVAEVRDETPTARRLTLEVPTWPGNEAGAHLDLRLTAPDGYQATRSYSIASSGDGTRVVLAVAEVPEGEVSPFLVHDLRAGDQLEVHGPLGAYFVWRPGGAAAGAEASPLRPVQLIGAGSGVVPLVAMAAAHDEGADATPFRLLYSVRTPADVFFADELRAFAEAPAPTRLGLDLVYTRDAPAGAARPPGRLTPDLVAELAWPVEQRPRIFICGPTPFVEAVAGWLVAAGHAPEAIRTERFGGA